jgi:hypothetical protein
MNRLEEIKDRLKNKYEALRLETELDDMEYLLSAYEAQNKKVEKLLSALHSSCLCDVTVNTCDACDAIAECEKDEG